METKGSKLRDKEEFAVGGVEEAIVHGGIGGVEVDGESGLQGRDRHCLRG